VSAVTIETRRTARARDGVGEHFADLAVLEAELGRNADRIGRWGVDLARRLLRGQRLLVAGNGGSAAEAQHLAAELVGRFQGERRAFSAIALTAETSSLTAIGNDYGFEQLFARQVEAHGRAGDVLMLLSTSGQSPNLLEAAAAARRGRVTVWCMTGPGPNPLTEASDDAVALATSSPHAQEGHLIAVHALCRAFDAAVAAWHAGDAP
jgi:phosphoheptose isomerase